jgi:hypothetical protein
VRGRRAGDFEIKMKTALTLDKNDFFSRFVSCARNLSLLKISALVARGVMDGGRLAIFPAGLNFADNFKPAIIIKINLTRREIFRGKISQRKNQIKPTDLEERTQPAPKK